MFAPLKFFPTWTKKSTCCSKPKFPMKSFSNITEFCAVILGDVSLKETFKEKLVELMLTKKPLYHPIGGHYYIVTSNGVKIFVDVHAFTVEVKRNGNIIKVHPVKAVHIEI